MIARIRLTIDKVFDFELEDVDESGHSESRINAAKYAEEDLINNLKDLVASQGKIIDIFVEEVRE